MNVKIPIVTCLLTVLSILNQISELAEIAINTAETAKVLVLILKLSCSFSTKGSAKSQKLTGLFKQQIFVKMRPDGY